MLNDTMLPEPHKEGPWRRSRAEQSSISLTFHHLLQQTITPTARCDQMANAASVSSDHHLANVTTCLQSTSPKENPISDDQPGGRWIRGLAAVGTSHHPSQKFLNLLGIRFHH